MRHLKLGTRFVLLLLAVLALGILGSWVALSAILLQRAQHQVASESLALIETMRGVREYTTQRVGPLLQSGQDSREEFVPEMIPAYSARRVFEYMRGDREYAHFLYKEASSDARYVGNRADTFEAELLERFRRDRTLDELSGFRTDWGEQMFYTARPLVLDEASCLRCHSDPAVAPQGLIAVYGAERAFGLELGDVVAAQIVYVSAEEVYNTARVSLSVVMLVFLLVFALAAVVINHLLQRTVVQPVVQMARLSQMIKSDTMDSEEFDLDSLAGVTKRTDELGQLAQVFKKMAQEVHVRESRMRQEIGQLRIQIDQVKRRSQVDEITESDFFKELQKKAQRFRDGKSTTDE